MSDSHRTGPSFRVEPLPNIVGHFHEKAAAVNAGLGRSGRNAGRRPAGDAWNPAFRPEFHQGHGFVTCEMKVPTPYRFPLAKGTTEQRQYAAFSEIKTDKAVKVLRDTLQTVLLRGHGVMLQAGTPATLAEFIRIDEVIRTPAAFRTLQRHEPRRSAGVQATRTGTPFNPFAEFCRYVPLVQCTRCSGGSCFLLFFIRVPSNGTLLVYGRVSDER